MEVQVLKKCYIKVHANGRGYINKQCSKLLGLKEGDGILILLNRNENKIYMKKHQDTYTFIAHWDKADGFRFCSKEFADYFKKQTYLNVVQIAENKYELIHKTNNP